MQIELNGKTYKRNEEGKFMVLHNDAWRLVAKTATKLQADLSQKFTSLEMIERHANQPKMNAAQGLLAGLNVGLALMRKQGGRKKSKKQAKRAQA